MAASVLADAPFEQRTLTYSIQSDEPTGTDEWGNPVFDPVQGTVRALFAPFKATQLQRQEGADAKSIRARGELVEPLTFPAGVRVGSVLTLDWAGRPHKLTITSIIPNDLPGVAFGDYFEGDMLEASS